MKQILCGLIILLCPTMIYALDCSAFPALFMGKMILAMANEPEIKECQSKPKEEKDACLTTTIRSLADKGNYPAQIGLASDACDHGNLTEVQKWLNTAVNNPSISQEDKDIVTKLVNTFGVNQK